MKPLATQLSRYAVVGVTSNAIGYLLYVGLTTAGLGPKVAMSVLYGVGVLQTFVFNRQWTFEHRGASSPVFIRYCTAYGAGYVVNLMALVLLVDKAGLPHQYVQGAMILVIAGLLFLAQRYWVFRAPADAARVG